MNEYPQDTECPYCHHRHDAATPINGDGGPAAGFISICVKCARWAVFAADLTVREPTAAERAAIRADAETWQLIRNASRAIIRLQQSN